MDTCERLERLIRPQDENDSILDSVWGFVYLMLKKDKNLKPATRDEFLQNVKSYPEGDFISKVKDMANAAEKPVTRWSALFSDGTYSNFFLARSALIIFISRCIL